MVFSRQTRNISFTQWFCEDRENKLIFGLSIIAILIQFAWLKCLYPFPNFMPPDSNSYVEAAYNNHTISIWPIGYSKFLRLVSAFTSSHFVLVLFQYILLQASVLYFLYSIKFLFNPNQWTFRLITAVSVLNPLLLHISNYVASDALFTTLSLLWFTQLLWILSRPGTQLLFLHALVLLFAFMVRYNALLYPIISIAVIAFASTKMREKVVGIGLIVLLLGAFTGRTAYRYYTATGTIQYSAFGGWMVAANALYGYAYASPIAVENVPVKFRRLHAVVNRHMDSVRVLSNRPDSEVGVYYFWDFKSPLRVYMDEYWSRDSSTGFFKRWAAMAPLYADYGWYLVKQHPGLFLKYYILPNLVKYYAPPANFLGTYNMGDETVDPVVVEWFQWKSDSLPINRNDRKILIARVLFFLPAIVNLIFILSFLAFSWAQGFNRSSLVGKQALWWMLIVWLGNLMFSVLSAPIELRYQLFPITITLAFAILLIEFLIAETGMISTKTSVGDEMTLQEIETKDILKI